MAAVLSYLLVVGIWATTPLAIKLSNDSVTPLTALGLRTLIALLCASMVILLLRRKSALKPCFFRSYLIGSISLFPNLILVYYAAQLIPSGLIALMYGLSPFVSGVFARFLLGEAFWSLRKMFAQLLAVAGLAIIFMDQLSVGASAGMGVLLMIGSVVLYSYSLVAVKREGRKQAVHPFDQTVGAMFFALPGIILSWLYFDGNTDVSLSHTSFWSIFYLSTVGSLLGFMAFYYVLSHFSVTMVSVIPMITPVLALWIGTVLAEEAITSTTLWGSAMILLGLSLYDGLWERLRKLKK